MRPLALTDDELNVVINLAKAVPVEHRDAFLKNLADALAEYTRGGGSGLVRREAARLQQCFAIRLSAHD
jgi:hypothetical protein